MCDPATFPVSSFTHTSAPSSSLNAADLANGQLDLVSALQALGAAGLTRVFCEGGGGLAASLLSSDLVDELVGFTAGLTIGAEGGPAIGALGLARLAEAPRFALIESRAIGPDILHRWRRT